MDGLDTSKSGHEGHHHGVAIMYYLQIVPNKSTSIQGEDYYSSQFTYSQQSIAVNGASSIFFNFNLSPVMIHYQEIRKSRLSFIIKLCAILGGVFTVTGIIESLLNESITRLSKKKD
jgi:hypothetical protein